MALIVITTKTAGKSVEIEFNDLSTQPNIKMMKSVMYKGNQIRLVRNEDGVIVAINELIKFDLSSTIVDSVDAVAITSDDQLYDLLDTIIADNLV